MYSVGIKITRFFNCGVCDIMFGGMLPHVLTESQCLHSIGWVLAKITSFYLR